MGNRNYEASLRASVTPTFEASCMMSGVRPSSGVKSY
jgi:hypothetical protein